MKKKLTIVVPCFNEKHTIQAVINKLQTVDLKHDIDREIIVVDDYSQDGTKLILNQFESKHGVEILYHEKNKGKGAALRTGFAASTGDYIVVQDADFEYNPEELHRLLDPLENDVADVVYGSRFLSPGPHRVLYFYHYLANKRLTFLSNLITNINLTDMETGYKMFRRSLLDKLSIRENRFGFEPEFTCKIARLKCRIYEVGINYYGRTYEEGKKIGRKDGFRALYCLAKYGVFNVK